MGLLAAIIVLFIAIIVPNFIHSGPGKISGIVNRLRQIDAAKQQWAIEHGITNAVLFKIELTTNDLAPYLLPSYVQKEFGDPIFHERYFIKHLSESPEAEILREVREYGSPLNWKLPKGVIVRLGSNNMAEYILPGRESKPCKSLSEVFAIE